MRTLIVDDEPVARKVLREELEALGSVEVVGEAENGAVALQQISAVKPDIVFLDIQMPVMNGFELLDCLSAGPHVPAIVMVTAYDQHAIRAFEAGAIDYLLKPIGEHRLSQALTRAERIARSPIRAAESLAHLQDTVPALSASGVGPRRIVGKLNGEFFLLNAAEVYAFRAEGEVTWILTAKQRYAATQNLKTIEERLQNSSFRRIHRNTLVNVEQIRKMSLLTSQRWLITLNNGQDFIVSKRQAKQVRDVLEW
jgi:DNA-binding LytR/AlgR family response regulator